MGLFELAFYSFAAIILISAIGVVVSRKMMYSAFSLLFTLFGVAGFYVLLNADFIAVTQLMVYVGGILVLIIFGVMLTQKITGVDIKEGSVGKLSFAVGGILASFIAVFFTVMYMNVDWLLKDAPITDSTITQLGNSLLTEYLLAFEVAAVLLLVAFIGAALIARRESN